MNKVLLSLKELENIGKIVKKDKKKAKTVKAGREFSRYINSIK